MHGVLHGVDVELKKKTVNARAAYVEMVSMAGGTNVTALEDELLRILHHTVSPKKFGTG